MLRACNTGQMPRYCPRNWCRSALYFIRPDLTFPFDSCPVRFVADLCRGWPSRLCIAVGHSYGFRLPLGLYRPLLDPETKAYELKPLRSLNDAMMLCYLIRDLCTTWSFIFHATLELHRSRSPYDDGDRDLEELIEILTVLVPGYQDSRTAFSAFGKLFAWNIYIKWWWIMICWTE